MKITRQELKRLINESIKESRSILLEFPNAGSEPRMGPNAPDDENEEGLHTGARKDLFHMGAQANQLHAMLTDDENLEPWALDKIAKAASALEEVFKYIVYEKQNPQGR
jgi:hypothetical protein